MIGINFRSSIKLVKMKIIRVLCKKKNQNLNKILTSEILIKNLILNKKIIQFTFSCVINRNIKLSFK